MTKRVRQGVGVALLSAVVFVVALVALDAGLGDYPVAEMVLRLAVVAAMFGGVAGVVVAAIGLIRDPRP